MKKFLDKIRNYFITGIAVIFPIFLTLIILKWAAGKINIWFLEPFVRFVRPYVDLPILLFFIKVILFFIILFLIILCGMATKIIFVHKFFGLGERLLIRLPLINKLYIAMRDARDVIFGQKKGLFKRVVSIEYPRQGLFAIGFVTAEHIDKNIVKRPFIDDLVCVYVPTAPNPTTGTFVFVEKKDVIDVDMSIEDALKLVLSGGALSLNKEKI